MYEKDNCITHETTRQKYLFEKKTCVNNMSFTKSTWWQSILIPCILKTVVWLMYLYMWKTKYRNFVTMFYYDNQVMCIPKFLINVLLWPIILMLKGVYLLFLGNEPRQKRPYNQTIFKSKFLFAVMICWCEQESSPYLAASYSGWDSFSSQSLANHLQVCFNSLNLRVEWCT